MSATAEGADQLQAIRSRAMSSSVLVVVGFALRNALRMGGNLVLTRLLFPEAFGLMAIVNALTTGMEMVSDLGIGTSVIQNRRGSEPRFRDTAWTVQVIRGVLLAAGLAALAGPIAGFYDDPQLILLILITSINPLLRGFTSISLSLMNRRMQLGRVIALETGTQVLGLALMIALAWKYQSVWVLAVGGIAGNLVRSVVSHWMSPEERVRFHWDRTAFWELFHFGKWIFLSTIMGFVSNHGDRLLMGRLLSMSELGFYAIAANVAFLMDNLAQRLTRRILLPLYSRMIDESTRLRSRVLRARVMLMSATLPPLWALVIFGSELVELLYDERYVGAGWILQVLAVASIVRIASSVGPVFLAHGHSSRQLIITTTYAIGLPLCMLVGAHFLGTQGVVYGVVASRLIGYPVLAWIAHRYGVWMPLLDLGTAALTGGVIFLAIHLN